MNDLREQIKARSTDTYHRYLTLDKNSKAVCPFHPDTDASLSVDLSQDRWKCFGCGAKGDSFTLYAKKHELDVKTQFPEILKQMAEDLNIDTPDEKSWGDEVNHFDYLDEDGQVEYRVVKYANGKCIPNRPDGNGGWIAGIKGYVDPILYNLNQLTAKDNKDKAIHITEGEKDADTLIALGLLSTTNALGALSWKSEYNEYFQDRDVVLFEDNDDAGRERVGMIANDLANIANSIKVITFTDMPAKSDVTDWLDSLTSASKLRKQMRLGAIIKTAPEWQPSAELNTTPSKVKLTAISLNELLNTDYPAIQEVIGDGLLQEQGGMIFAGESGAGKSMMVMEWCLHLAMGIPLFDGLFAVPKKRKVLVFQKENTKLQVKYRMTKMIESMGINSLPETIYLANRQYRYDLQSNECVEDMINLIKHYDADVFMIDPLSSFHMVSENDNVMMRAVLDQATYISSMTDAASIIIHHYGKPGKDKADEYRLRGASSIKDWADTVVALSKKPSQEDKIIRQIRFDKVRNGRQPRPILIERDDRFISHVTEGEMVVTPKQIADIVAAEFGGTVQKSGLLVKYLTDGFDCSRTTAFKCIKNAVDMGTIKQVDGVGKTKMYVNL